MSIYKGYKAKVLLVKIRNFQYGLFLKQVKRLYLFYIIIQKWKLY
jgi:hypothetical protein